MKNKRNLVFVLAFIFGLLVLLYPDVSSAVLMSRGSSLTEKFDAAVAAAEDTAALDEAVRYNSTLRGAETNDVFSAYDKTVDARYLSLADPLGNGMMAAVEIPSLHTTLPVFHHNVKSENSSGLAHIAGSALPVGGANSHSVVSSHSGSTVRRVFEHAVTLAPGERIYVHSLSGILCYEVEELVSVAPSDVSALSVDPGLDRFTIVLPNGSDRLLVRTCRMNFDPDTYAADVASGRSPALSNLISKTLCIVVAVLLVVAAVVYLPRLKARKVADSECPKPKKSRKPEKHVPKH